MTVTQQFQYTVLKTPEYQTCLSDSGQTKCYYDAREIACPASGDNFFGADANYTINQPSFTKLDAMGNALMLTATEWTMVRDNITGLIWEIKTNDGSIHDRHKKYTWYDSNPETNGGDAGYTNNNINTEAFIQKLNQNIFGGFSDWRMPDRVELISIVDYSKYDPAAFEQFFPEVMSAFYWSSTSYANYIGYAWGAYFSNGDDDYSAKDSSNYVRAVRGAQYRSFDHLVINPDETITDTKAGLMWQKNGKTEPLSWQEAINYCETLNESDHHNWRLANQKELFSITDLKKYYQAVDTNYFSNMLSAFYWSSTSNAGNAGNAWGVNFYNGNGSYNAKDLSYYVRAVRGGQCSLLGHLVIWSPNQGSKWTIGSEMPIVWGTQLIPGNVQISLSRKGGKKGTFEMLAETENDGLFDWSVTGPASVNCVLTIIPIGAPDKVTSQGFFSVVDETPPVLSHIDNGYIASAGRNIAINFYVSDSDEGSIMIWGKSSNESVFRNERVDLGGNHPNCYTSATASGGTKKLTMSLLTAGHFDTAGKTTITLTAYDAGFLTDTTSFEVIVPISTVLPQRAFINEPHAVSFSIYNDKYTADSLAVRAHSSNTDILPDSELTINGSGNDRILSIPPVSTAPFICNITIIVSDPDGLTVSQQFQYTVLKTPEYQTRLSDSGQIKCYYHYREIACPASGDKFFGSDANYTINQPSFTKLDAMGNALMLTATEWTMVRDNITGLIWEIKTNDGSIHDRDNTYTWYDSNPETNGGNAGETNNNINTEAFIQQLNQDNFGGFSDWRMPDMDELRSIVDYSKYDPAAFEQFFP